MDVVLERLVKTGLKVGRYGHLSNVSWRYKDLAQAHNVDALAADLLKTERPDLTVDAKAWRTHL